MEILAVLSLIAVMAGVAGPALSSIAKARQVSRASQDLVGLLELARVYSMSKGTYVRIGFAEGEGLGGVVVLPIYAADHSLHADMADPAQWPLLRQPLILQRMKTDDSLNAGTPETSLDQLPSSSTIGSFLRKISGRSEGILFSSVIQFSPNGEAQIEKGKTVRHIKIAVTSSENEPASNPFIVRISGIGGSISVLRKGDGM